MGLIDQFRNDPRRKELLQQIINAYDYAVVSHELNSYDEVVISYDKYSIIKIDKLKAELRNYETSTYPNFRYEKRKGRVQGWKDIFIYIDDLDENNEINKLEIELLEALKKEDFETCEKLKNQIENLRKK